MSVVIGGFTGAVDALHHRVPQKCPNRLLLEVGQKKHALCALTTVEVFADRFPEGQARQGVR